MSTETNQEAEVANPYAGKYGVRNAVKVPWVQRVVVKGDRKGQPYLTLDFNQLNINEFVNAVGIEVLKELVEARFNVSGRNHCDNIADDAGNYDLDQFQAWADGIVIERPSMITLRNRLIELAMKNNLTDEEMLEMVDVRTEMQARKKK